MLKEVIKRIADEVETASLDPLRMAKLAIKLQTLHAVMEVMHSFDYEDAFYSVFPRKAPEPDGESAGGEK